MTQTAKTKYRIRNWKQCNRFIINRGSITFWFSNDVIDQWNSTERSGNRGRPQLYSNEAILWVVINM
ncbi:MAG: transposase [Chlamydiales bacterium]|nr:transposase [Chlamydiia bacterium]MCP5507561.1 transposase [Chlamydiales bacterium]